MGDLDKLMAAYSLTLALNEQQPEVEQQRLMNEYIAIVRRDTAATPSTFLQEVIGGVLLAQGALVSGALSVVAGLSPDEPDMAQRFWEAMKSTANMTLNMVALDDELGDIPAPTAPVPRPAGLPPEMRRAVKDCWQLVAAFADAEAEAAQREELIRALTAKYGTEVVLGAIAYIAGSGLMNVIASDWASDLPSVTAEVGRRLLDSL